MNGVVLYFQIETDIPKLDVTGDQTARTGRTAGVPIPGAKWAIEIVSGVGAETVEIHGTTASATV